jgi:hypothetical protein
MPSLGAHLEVKHLLVEAALHAVLDGAHARQLHVDADPLAVVVSLRRPYETTQQAKRSNAGATIHIVCR